MKRSITWVFILMSLCVAGITALQLYYSYKSYAVESTAFERNINEALTQAVDSAFKDRRNVVLKKFRGWLNDPGFVTISCKWNALYKATVFTIKQVEPSAGGQNEMSMSLDYYTPKTDSITPQAREVFVNHMVGYVDDQLQKGVSWYYTQKLGDSVNKAAFSAPHDMNQISMRYRQMLAARGVDLPFLFRDRKHAEDVITTNKVNIAIGRPQKTEWLSASFADVNLFLLKKMQWLLIGSLVLFAILLFCFWYTIKTLLSQQKLNALKDDFINNMTHEIHTPLAGITVTAQALKQFSHSPEEHENYLDIILHQAGKLSTLTDEILAGARLGIDNEAKESVLVNRFLEDIVHGFGREPRIEISLLPDTGIRIYKNHLGRAVSNLLDNALKYSDGQVMLSGKTESNTLYISIADNGPGIPAEFKDKVFDTFYRIPTGNVHNIKGHGLGLSYVKKAAGMHGGRVVISDNSPQGAVFTLILPL